MLTIWQHDQCFFLIFRKKRHKIVELFAPLTTEISSYKMCKVGMLFCTLRLQFNVNYNTERFVNRF